MLKKTLVAAALAAASGAALAHPPHWAPAHGYRAQHDRPHVRYYPAAPRVVYRPVRVYPAPVVVPAPRVVLPAPIFPPPGIVVRLHFPL